jgi:hypothetical protein
VCKKNKNEAFDFEKKVDATKIFSIPCPKSKTPPPKRTAKQKTPQNLANPPQSSHPASPLSATTTSTIRNRIPTTTTNHRQQTPHTPHPTTNKKQPEHSHLPTTLITIAPKLAWVRWVPDTRAVLLAQQQRINLCLARLRL